MERRVADLESRLTEYRESYEEAAAVLPALQEAAHSLSAQSGEQAAALATLAAGHAEITRAITRPRHLDAVRQQVDDTQRRVGTLERDRDGDRAAAASKPPPTGAIEQAWTFFVGIGLQVAEFAGLRRRPWLLLVYIVLGLLAWGVRSVYLDNDARDLLIRSLDRQSDEIHRIGDGVDTLLTVPPPYGPGDGDPAPPDE